VSDTRYLALVQVFALFGASDGTTLTACEGANVSPERVGLAVLGAKRTTLGACKGTTLGACEGDTLGATDGDTLEGGLPSAS
jgi:hypothetical protein